MRCTWLMILYNPEYNSCDANAKAENFEYVEYVDEEFIHGRAPYRCHYFFGVGDDTLHSFLMSSPSTHHSRLTFVIIHRSAYTIAGPSVRCNLSFTHHC